MKKGTLRNINAPYRPLESWLYDRCIAPAVADFSKNVLNQKLQTIPARASVLDIGCGGGHLISLLADLRSDVNVTGLDLSFEQVSRAEARIRKFDDRCKVLQGSALDLPFPDNSFDVVASVASIKHWPDKIQGLRECLRVTRPGGHIWVVETDRNCTLDDARAFIESWRIPHFMHPVALGFFRTWIAGQSPDIAEARSLAERAGAKNLRVATVPTMPAWLIEANK